MTKSIVELKAHAYDLGKQLSNLQVQANVIADKIRKVNEEIDKREKTKN